MGAPEDLKTTAIIPVKRLDAAHGRLAGSLSPELRWKLAEAMFLDAVGKIRRSRCIDSTLIVTADDSVARHARWLGHEVLLEVEDRGHSEAAAAGARKAVEDGADRVAMLPVDCPMLDPAELDDHLGHSPRSALIVPDRHGTGTNALVLCPPDAIEPGFGPDSCARHISRARSAGISFALIAIHSLSLDLDTPEDLQELRDALLLDPEPAPRTAKLLWELGAEVTVTAA
jgi:2-phospho-L-lactate guanylyltransferase